MKSRQFSFNCTEDIYQLIKTKSEENGVSMSQQVGDYLNLLKDEMYIQNVGQAIVSRVDTTINTKLEEQTKLLTDLINDKITPVGIVLPDNFAAGILDATDDDLVKWDDDVHAVADRLINRCIVYLHSYNYTIEEIDRIDLTQTMGNATIKLI